MIQYLSPEQVLFLHSRLIDETGGMHGVRDLGMLLSALGRPLAAFSAEELYPDIFNKTAALMDLLVQNRPFVDGNKRTAIASAGIFLLMNGYPLVVAEKEMVWFSLACAQAKLSLPEIAAWFEKNSIILGGP